MTNAKPSTVRKALAGSALFALIAIPSSLMAAASGQGSDRSACTKPLRAEYRAVATECNAADDRAEARACIRAAREAYRQAKRHCPAPHL